MKLEHRSGKETGKTPMYLSISPKYEVEKNSALNGKKQKTAIYLSISPKRTPSDESKTPPETGFWFFIFFVFYFGSLLALLLSCSLATSAGLP